MCREGVENGETLSQSQAEDYFFPCFSDSPRAESRLFLSLYPECLAYCKSSINRHLLNRNKSFVEFPVGKHAKLAPAQEKATKEVEGRA